MISLKIILPIVATLTFNIVVSIGYLLACVNSDAKYIVLGAADDAGYKIYGHKRMTLCAAVYGFFWIPVILYNVCAPRSRKIHLIWGPNTHCLV